MKAISNKNSGCYLLNIYVPHSCQMKVGALGNIFFNAGYYIYVGRARINLRQRVNRHLGTIKKIRWHIDYLLRKAEIIDLLVTENLDECLIARKLSELSNARIIDRFGSGDCHCRGHLIGLTDPIPSEELVRSFSSLGLTHPLDWQQDLR